MVPRSAIDQTGGMAYFPRMLDKIRLRARGELEADYLPNFGGKRTGDGMCCNFLRVSHDALRARVAEGGTDEEILEWCCENGRRLNEGDIRVWNGFIAKLGWNDFASGYLATCKAEAGFADRDDIRTLSELFDAEERGK